MTSTTAFTPSSPIPLHKPAISPSLSKRAARVSAPASSRRAPPSMTSGRPEMPDSAKRAVAAGEPVKYWQGEWICVDCGFIYKPSRRVKFEDLPSSWKCPQCSAPKRRFAKKVGSFVAETKGTSNVPIIVFSVAGLVATIAFGIWASSNL